MNKVLLIDSGFWCGLYDPKDQHHEQANAVADDIGANRILIPWPTMYEFMNTRFVRQKNGILAFQVLLNNPRLTLVDDGPYREKALASFFQSKRYSLTDAIIRGMLLDSDLPIDYLVTFNRADFEDVCYLKRVEIVDGL